MSKTHVIDGVTYVEVERKAEVGDKVLIVDAWHTGGKYENGSVIDVHRIDSYGIVNDDIKSDEYNEEGIILRREYRVIERLKPSLSELLAKCTPENRHEEVFVDESQASEQVEVDERDASPSVVEMLANLARRVTSLESQLRDTQRNLETFAEQTENNSEDIRTLDERTQPKENSEINRLADFILKHYGHEIGLGNPQEGESAVDVAIRLLTPVTVPKYLVEGIR